MKDDVKILQEETLKQINNHWLGWQERDNEKVLKADRGIWACLNKLEELTGLLWNVDLETGEFHTFYFSYWTHPVHYELL